MHHAISIVPQRHRQEWANQKKILLEKKISDKMCQLKQITSSCWWWIIVDKVGVNSTVTYCDEGRRFWHAQLMTIRVGDETWRSSQKRGNGDCEDDEFICRVLNWIGVLWQEWLHSYHHQLHPPPLLLIKIQLTLSHRQSLLTCDIWNYCNKKCANQNLTFYG